MAMQHIMKEPCPQCGRREGVPVVFGHSRNNEIAEMENRGEIVWGGRPLPLDRYDGCINRQCLHCEFTWRAAEHELAGEVLHF